MRNRPEDQITNPAMSGQGATENKTTLILIRHGAAQANQEHRYLGKTDQPLSREGMLQLAEYRKQQCYPDIDFLFASPMKRCIQTAELLYPEIRSFLIKEWEEIDFGAFEGKNYLELQGDERYQAWIDSQGMLPFPGGESREEFLTRCGRGFRRMAGEVKQMKKRKEPLTVGCIVHGGTIMALLSQYGGGDYFDYQTANGKGYICTVRNFEDKPEIVAIHGLTVGKW